MKRGNVSAFLLGVLATALVSGLALPAAALSGSKTAQLFYRDIRISLNGRQITPKDANGKTVDPFIIDGTTYLPVRAVAEALGLSVGWDDGTSTVLLSDASEEPGAYRPAEDQRITLRRTEAAAAGACCAVADLGYRVDALSANLTAQDIYGAYPEYEGLAFVDAGGENLFVLIPADPDGQMAVERAELGDDGTLHPADALYLGDGEAILLRCNVSDIVPNVLVTVRDGAHNEWIASPALSLRDGRVEMKNAYDFTDYPEGMIFED